MHQDDLFEAVDLLEKEEYAKGEAEGLADGKKKAWQQGYTYGWQQSCHIQQELGRIEGLFSSLLINCESDINPKLQKQIEKLLTNVKEWTDWKPANEEELEANLTSFHAKSRFLLKQLKIPSTVIDRSVDSEF